MRLYLVSIKYPPSKLSNTKNFPRQIVFPPLGRKWLYLHICIQFSQIARVLQRYQIMYLILTRALQNQWSVIHIVFPCVLRRGKFSNFTSSFANDYQLGKKDWQFDWVWWHNRYLVFTVTEHFLHQNIAQYKQNNSYKFRIIVFLIVALYWIYQKRILISSYVYQKGKTLFCMFVYKLSCA